MSPLNPKSQSDKVATVRAVNETVSAEEDSSVHRRNEILSACVTLSEKSVPLIRDLYQEVLQVDESPGPSSAKTFPLQMKRCFP